MMRYIFRPGVPAQFVQIVNPFTRLQRHLTRKLLRVDCVHEAHDGYSVFRQGNWKLLVRNHLVWFSYIEVHDSRTGQHIFRVKGPDRTDVIQITDERGRLERTIVFEEDAYKAYLDLLSVGWSTLQRR